MDTDLAKLLTTTPLWILAIAAALYVARGWFDAAVKARFAGLEKRVEAGLELGKGLRGHETDELAGFRIAVEKWEYFLQTAIGDVTMGSEDPDFDVGGMAKRDHKRFGDVRLAAVKASIYLRDPALETELLRTIMMIRQLYYPMLQATLAQVLDLQGRMVPYLLRMRQYEASGMKDTAVALTADEAAVLIGLRHEMTAALQGYAQTLAAGYKPIAEQLYDLKAKINAHIYRPVGGGED